MYYLIHKRIVPTHFCKILIGQGNIYKSPPAPPSVNHHHILYSNLVSRRRKQRSYGISYRVSHIVSHMVLHIVRNDCTLHGDLLHFRISLDHIGQKLMELWQKWCMIWDISEEFRYNSNNNNNNNNRLISLSDCSMLCYCFGFYFISICWLLCSLSIYLWLFFLLFVIFS